MIDITLIRENKELVKENIKKKFQDQKLPLVDEVYDLDLKFREAKQKGDNLRALKNEKSALIGNLMREGKKDEALAIKDEIANYGKEIADLEKLEEELSQQVKEKMMVIPNIIDASVPGWQTNTVRVSNCACRAMERSKIYCSPPPQKGDAMYCSIVILFSESPKTFPVFDGQTRAFGFVKTARICVFLC